MSVSILPALHFIHSSVRQQVLPFSQTDFQVQFSLSSWATDRSQPRLRTKSSSSRPRASSRITILSFCFPSPLLVFNIFPTLLPLLPSLSRQLLFGHLRPSLVEALPASSLYVCDFCECSDLSSQRQNQSGTKPKQDKIKSSWKGSQPRVFGKVKFVRHYFDYLCGDFINSLTFLPERQYQNRTKPATRLEQQMACGWKKNSLSWK